MIAAIVVGAVVAALVFIVFVWHAIFIRETGYNCTRCGGKLGRGHKCPKAGI